MRRLTVMLLTLHVSANESSRTVAPPSSISDWYNSNNGSSGDDDPAIDSSTSGDEGPSSWMPPPGDRRMGNGPPEKGNPMKTLEKLQEMLDDTDYLMNRRPLWTSRDRTKYKRQQKRFRKMEDEESDETTDDGLGYTLPDLPIYNSDVEDESNAEEPYPQGYSQQFQAQKRHDTSNIHSPWAPHQQPNQAPKQQQSPQNHQPPIPPLPNGSQYVPPPHQNYKVQRPPDSMPYRGAPKTSNFPHPPPPKQEHQYPPPYPPPRYQPDRYQPYPYSKIPTTSEQQHLPARSISPNPETKSDAAAPTERPWTPLRASQPFIPQRAAEPLRNSHQSGASPSNRDLEVSQMPNYPIVVEESPARVLEFENSVEVLNTGTRETLVEASTDISLSSFLKLGHLSLVASLLAYAAVSPRSLPLTQYNLQFYENLRLVIFAGIAPAVYMLSVFNARFNDVNAVTHSFFVTASMGYVVAFFVEVLSTTVIRLSVFCLFERGVFALTPQVPIPIIPWVLKDQQYRPKRITVLVADFVTSCIFCPIVEETVKYMFLRWTVDLPKNFRWVTKYPSKRKRKRRIAEPIIRTPGESDCVNANPYITQMLAVSMALKLADITRRVLLYTKPKHANKGFYAICRGLFPIQELCGTMTALAMAKRDLLGFHIPLWKLLAPAVVVHGMANFRGMKPIFKWNSSTPWSEMQLSPFNVPDASSFLQILKRGYAKLMWLIILSRVFGYCVKNYFMVNRQALKRTTKYAGNHAAFYAELTTAETLKNQKKK